MTMRQQAAEQCQNVSDLIQHRRNAWVDSRLLVRQSFCDFLYKRLRNTLILTHLDAECERVSRTWFNDRRLIRHLHR